MRTLEDDYKELRELPQPNEGIEYDPLSGLMRLVLAIQAQREGGEEAAQAMLRLPGRDFPK